MSPTNPETLLPEVRRIARAAGAAILAVQARDFDVTLKDDHSPLTAADRAAHDVIVAALGALTPGVPVWSEESSVASTGEQARSTWSRFWLVDPLDGTREFIQGNGEFTVNIALVEHHAPRLGVVYAPVLKREYFGMPGAGAWRADGKAPPVPLRVRRPAPAVVRIAGSRSHRGASLDAFLASVGAHEFVAMGSSLKFCLVAEGSADVYPRLGPTAAWDTAAAQAVVEAAGGAVVDLAGHALRYNRGPDVLNPHFVAFGDPERDWPGLLIHCASSGA